MVQEQVKGKVKEAWGDLIKVSTKLDDLKQEKPRPFESVLEAIKQARAERS
jgi:hypothetical protein